MPGGKHVLGQSRDRHIFGTVKVGEKGQIVIPKAVSYTHLDVYKRQAYAAAGIGRAAG